MAKFKEIAYYLFLLFTAFVVIYCTMVDMQDMIGRESSDCGNSLPLLCLSDTQLFFYCSIRSIFTGFIFGFCLYFHQKNKFKTALKLAICAWIFMLFTLWLETTYMYGTHY
jgi:hypothetical protein